MLEDIYLRFGYDQDGEKDDQNHRGTGEWNHSVEQDGIFGVGERKKNGI